MGSLKKYRPVQANKVAEFMVEMAHEESVSGVHVYESDFFYVFSPKSGWREARDFQGKIDFDWRGHGF